MNHCLLEVEVIQPPTIRYTQDNQTPIAEMEVRFAGLRAEDEPSHLKVVGWGNLAQELPNRVQAGQKLLLEGRLRMNTMSRQDGTKEKRAEFTLSRLHPLGSNSTSTNLKNDLDSPAKNEKQPNTSSNQNYLPKEQEDKKDISTTWNSAPLVPDTDDIPF